MAQPSNESTVPAAAIWNRSSVQILQRTRTRRYFVGLRSVFAATRQSSVADFAPRARRVVRLHGPTPRVRRGLRLRDVSQQEATRRRLGGIYSRVSKTIRANFTNFSVHVMLSVVVARSSSDDSAVRYVLPVLQMTSCLPITGNMARG